MTVKVVEYVHEYDEEDWYYKKSEGENGIPAGKAERVNYISHVTETHYAVSNPGYTSTDEKGEINNYDHSSSWNINGTTLVAYSREDINGLIGLLTKLRDEEFPEEPQKEIVTFGD